MIKNNCRDCMTRELGCHSNCITYNNFTAALQEKKEHKLDQFDSYKRDRLIQENEYRIKIGKATLGNSKNFANC